MEELFTSWHGRKKNQQEKQKLKNNLLEWQKSQKETSRRFDKLKKVRHRRPTLTNKRGIDVKFEQKEFIGNACRRTIEFAACFSEIGPKLDLRTEEAKRSDFLFSACFSKIRSKTEKEKSAGKLKRTPPHNNV